MTKPSENSPEFSRALKQAPHPQQAPQLCTSHRGERAPHLLDAWLHSSRSIKHYKPTLLHTLAFKQKSEIRSSLRG